MPGNWHGHDSYSQGPPDGQSGRGQKRVGDDLGQAGDRKRVNVASHSQPHPRDNGSRSPDQANETQTWTRRSNRENGPSRSPPIHPDRLYNMQSNGSENEGYRSRNLTPLSPPQHPPVHPRAKQLSTRESTSVSDEVKKNKTYDNGSFNNRDRDRDSDPPEPVMASHESRRDVTRRESNDHRRARNVSSPIGEPHGGSINPSPSGSRSGNFQSRMFTGPNKQSDHSQPPSRPPSDLNNLTKAFTLYTESVVESSSLLVQRNLVKEKAERQQNLKDRWSKHYHNFISLAEDHDRVSEKAGSVAESFDNQLKLTQEAQDVAVRTLMSAMMASSAAANPKMDELSGLREDVWSLKEGLSDTRYEVSRTKGAALQQDLEQKLRTMSEYEKKVAELTVVHNKLQAAVSQHETLLVQVPDIRDRVHKLNASQGYFTELKDKTKEALEAIKEQKANAKTLNDDLATQKTSIQGLLKDFASKKGDFKQSIKQNFVGQNQKIDAFVKDFVAEKEKLAQSIADQEKKIETVVSQHANQKERIDSLSIELVGDPDEKANKHSKGLIDYIAEGREKSDKFENALVVFDKELESFSEKLGSLENGMRIVESRAPIQESASTRVDNTAHNLAPEFVDRISSLEELIKVNNADSVERISDLERQAKSVEEQQEMKDDFVAAEVERLDNLLIKQEKAAEALHDDLSALKAQVSSASVDKPPTPPPQIEIQREPDDSFRLKVEELENSLRHLKESSTERVDKMEVLVDSQQQRFDNLSTEHLAKSIIHQMQILYPPHPAGLQAKVDQMKNKQSAVDQHILNFVQTINRLSENVLNHTNRIDHLQGIAFPGLEKKHLDMTKRFGDKIQEMERRILDLDAFARNQISMDKRFAESPKPPSDAQAGFERKLGEFKKASVERIESLDRKHSELKQNSVNRFADVERKQAELAKAVSNDQLDWRQHCHNLRTDIEEHSRVLNSVSNGLSTLQLEHASQMATFENRVKTTQSRLNDVEATTTQEIASFHGSLSTLKNQVSLPRPESRAVQDLDSDAPLAQLNTLTKSLRNTTGPTAEKQERQEKEEKEERQERQPRQRGKRKKGASPSDLSYSSDSDLPATRPVRKSNRGIHMMEKRITRGRSRSGGEHRS